MFWLLPSAAAAPTWAAIRCQVAVAVAVACRAAVDAAVVVVGAGVGPGVGQPGLRGRFPDVKQARPFWRENRRRGVGGVRQLDLEGLRQHRNDIYANKLRHPQEPYLKKNVIMWNFSHRF